MPLGLMLVSRGSITEDQLRTAKERQQATQQEMGAILLSLGFADEDQITAARLPFGVARSLRHLLAS